MKIGIITFHCAENYGAMLQSFALRTFIENKLNIDTEIIDYRTVSHMNAYKKFKIRRSLKKTFISLMLYLKFYRSDNLREKRFSDFMDKFILTGKRIDKYILLERYSCCFDAIITGSDQVFGTYKNDNNPYFLDFVGSKKTKKIAYSASYGFSDIDKNYINKIKNLLKSFHAISIRESSGSEFTKEITGKNIQTVIDPSLLITGEEWVKIFNLKKKEKENYVLCYSLVGSKEQICISKKIQNKYNYNIKVISNRLSLKDHSIEVINNAGPREFLELFYNASYVVTDSFHGTCFSIVFEKDFNSYIKLEKKADRIYTLLNKLNLMDRIVSRSKIYKIETGKINYSNLTELIDKERDLARDFIVKSIGD